MKKTKRRIIWITISLVSLIIILGISYYFVAPHTARCHLIGFYDFKKDANLYYRSDVKKEDIDHLKEQIDQAEIRVKNFWGEKLSKPVYVYCTNDKDCNRFGSDFDSPAYIHKGFATYIILTYKELQLGGIAHELNHAELWARFGFIERKKKIPKWFDEGLAMQVDDRDISSIKLLKQKSNNFTNLPDIKKMKTTRLFRGKNSEETLLNYLAAKYEVQNWYTDEKLKNLIKNIKNGMSFEEAYNK
jgi:hypothetical protein